MDRSRAIEELRRELDRLTIASEKVRGAIATLESEHETSSSATASTRKIALDRYDSPIAIGDRVVFLTKGKFPSTEGIVSRFSKNRERVFATDSEGREIPRAPRNVRVKNCSR